MDSNDFRLGPEVCESYLTSIMGSEGFVWKFDLVRYRTQPTEPFQVMFPDNGIFGVAEGGPSQVVADGFYILTEPLTSGNHTVHYKSSLSCPDVGCVEPAFA